MTASGEPWRDSATYTCTHSPPHRLPTRAGHTSSRVPCAIHRKTLLVIHFKYRGSLPKWLSGKESVCNAGVMGSVHGTGRFPGEGNGNPLQCSCLENPMDRGAGQATVHGVPKESDTTEWINNRSTPNSLTIPPPPVPNSTWYTLSLWLTSHSMTDL